MSVGESSRTRVDTAEQTPPLRDEEHVEDGVKPLDITTGSTPRIDSRFVEAEVEETGRDVRMRRIPLLARLVKLDTLRVLGRVVSLLVIDAVAVYAALFTALGVKWLVRHDGSFDWTAVQNQTLEFWYFAVLLTALLFARSDLYSSRTVRPGMSKVVACLFQVTVVALIFAVVSGEKFQSFYLFYASLFFAIIYVASARFLYERITGALLRAAGFRRRTVLVGSGSHVDEVAEAFSHEQHSPVELVGFVSTTPREKNGLDSLGEYEEMPEILASARIEEVIITDPDFPQENVVELADLCHRLGVRVHVAPSTMEILVHRAEFVPGRSIPLFEVKPPVLDGADFALKRAFDIVASLFLILLFSPVLLALALAIKLTSRGSVFYASVRPGLGGKPFNCLKFRSMYDEADSMMSELEGHNEADGALFKMREDPRVTPLGKWMRRYSLDEFPQLFNVVRGEMSLVGPRPLPTRDYDRLEDWHRKRYLVLPGLTGLWQVSGRSDLEFDDLVRLDFLYLERWSIFLDVVILLRTPMAVLSRRGAF